mmetsp:Transcript_10515/g.26194  ORF Transcript_10515/g.26194 Transcript_10515/m.26194 type:complete len:229 (+) Transcript_10515:866-1552(+)
MVDQGLAGASSTGKGLRRPARDHVEGARRCTGRCDDLAKRAAGQRSEWRGFEDDGTACCKGGCHLHDSLHQRIVPRCDTSDHTKWLLHQLRKEVLIAPCSFGQGQLCRCEMFGRDIGIVVENISTKADVPAALCQCFATIPALNNAKLCQLRRLPERPCDPAQHLRTLLGRLPSPRRGGIEARFGRAHGTIDVPGRGMCQRCESAAINRRHHTQGGAAFTFHVLVVDE